MEINDENEAKTNENPKSNSKNIESIEQVIKTEENSNSNKKIIDKPKSCFAPKKSIKKNVTQLLELDFCKMKFIKPLIIPNLNNSNSSLLGSNQQLDVNSKKVLNTIMTSTKKLKSLKLKSTVIKFDNIATNSTNTSVSPKAKNRSRFFAGKYWEKIDFTPFLENIKSNRKQKNRLNNKNSLILRSENLIKHKRFFRNLQKKFIVDKLKSNIKKLNIFYILLLLCVIINYIFSIIDNEIYLKKSIAIFEDNNYHFNSINFVSLIKSNKNYIKIMENRKLTDIENFIRFSNGIFSILSTLFNILIYKTQLKILLMNNSENVESSKTIHKKSNKKILVLESLFLIIFYPPFINKVIIGSYYSMLYIHPLNAIFLIFTTIKLFVIFKFLIFSSNLNSLLGKIVCSSNYTHLSNILIFRAYIKKYPYILVIFICIIMVFSMSNLIYYMEYFLICLNCTTQHEINILVINKQLTNNMYKLLLFLIRLNKFEMSPKTFSGKILFFVTVYIGLVFSSNFYNNLFQKIIFIPEEKKAYSKLKKLFRPENKEHKACNVIRVFLRLYSLHSKYNSDKKIYDEELKENIFTIYETQENLDTTNLDIIKQKRSKLLSKFYVNLFILKLKFLNDIVNFENVFKIANNYSIPFDDVLNKVGEKMRSNTTLLNQELDDILELDEKLNHLVLSQKKSLMKLRSVINYNTELVRYLFKRHNENILGKSSRIRKKIFPLIKNNSFYHKTNHRIKLSIPNKDENKEDKDMLSDKDLVRASI